MRPGWKTVGASGGLGGRPVPNDPKTRLFLGGGGGSGDDYMGKSGEGGSGGGLIFIDADRITGSGTIRADGDAGGTASGNGSGGGGGGAGGTVILAAENGIDGVSVSASGGGGSQDGTSANASGPGGPGGGGGFIGRHPGVQVPAASTAGRAALRHRAPWSPSRPTAPARAQQACGSTPQLALWRRAVLLGGRSLRHLDRFASPGNGRRSADAHVTVQNQGPSYTGNVLLRLTLPPLVRLSTPSPRLYLPAQWAEVLCRLSNLPVGTAPAIAITVQPAQGRHDDLRRHRIGPSTDTVPENNQANLTVMNTLPLYARPAGGGTGCAAIPVGGGRPQVALWLSWRLFWRPLRRRRRRQGQGRQPVA